MLSSKKWSNKASDIKLVDLYSTIKMMHGPINLRFTNILMCHKYDIVTGGAHTEFYSMLILYVFTVA